MTIESYHIIDLPDDTTTKGRVDRRSDPKYCGLEGCPLLKGSRVLDVGAFDGVWSFWAERQGAEYVLAVDVEELSQYDWGWEGPPEEVYTKERRDSKFYEIRELLNSKVDRKVKTVYSMTS